MKKSNINKKICSITVSSVMFLGSYGSVFAAPLAKLPSISNNSLVLGSDLYELDNVNNSIYNLSNFVNSAKTVNEKNGVYYKFNGKWYTGKDIESLSNLKNGKGLDSISNDILKINGKDSKDFINKNNIILDWYQDGDFSHKETAKDKSVEQFVVYFNKPVKQNVGKLRIVIPNNSKADPYGKDKLGEIECTLDGSSKPKKLENIDGGMPVTLFIVKDKGKDETIKEGYTDRFVIELTEDWTRVLNTEKTSINYYDKNIKGLKLVAEGLEDKDGNKVNATAKRNINLVKDDEKPYIVANEPIYTQIGENGTQIAGKTRILFNEPIQLLTEDNIKDLEKLKVKQPYVLGSFSRGKYIQYNPITPNQEQLKSKYKGVPVFNAEYRKVDDNGKAILGADGKPEVVKGLYAKRGDVFESNEAIDENGDKIKLRLNQLKFKYDFDKNNKGITRFRDYGTILVTPQECLTEGKWQLVIKNVSDDAGNNMDEYVSDSINITKYFDVVELTNEKVKIKFTKPFEKSPLWGNRIPVAVTNDTGKPYGVTWINNLKEGQVEAEGVFTKPLKDLKGTVYVNTMEYKVKENSDVVNPKPAEKPSEPIEKPNEPVQKLSEYKDGVYEGEGNGCMGVIKVKVTIKNGKMNVIDIVDQHETPSFFNKAKVLIGKILNKKSTNVDNVTTATLSSEGIKEAVSNALEKAKVIEDESPSLSKYDSKVVSMNLNWYQDGNFSGKSPQDASIEQFVIYSDKKFKANKGTLKIIVPDNSKDDPYGKDKLGEIEVKLDCKGESKPLVNVKGGKPVSCMIIGKNEGGYINRLVLELNRDWTEILNTKKTNINYYDEKIKGLRLIAEGLEDENGNVIENKKGTAKVVAKNDITLAKDENKPHIVAQKILYSKIGENGLQKSGQLGVVFNKPVQLFTQEMVDAGVIPSETYVGDDPLTPSQSQKEKYKNGLPVFKAYYEKLDGNGKIFKDKEGKPVIINGKDALMGTILPKEGNGEPDEEAITLKINEINHKFDLDPQNTDISRFRDYGVYFIDPEINLPKGKWRIVISGITDDAGNEMDEYKSQPFDITPCFTIESLTKEGIKVKFTGDGFKPNPIIGNNLTVVIAQNGQMVDAVVLENLKIGQKEAEAKFDEPLAKLEGVYNINNIEYTVK